MGSRGVRDTSGSGRTLIEAVPLSMVLVQRNVAVIQIREKCTIAIYCTSTSLNLSWLKLHVVGSMGMKKGITQACGCVLCNHAPESFHGGKDVV